jgi:type I restriction enzyme R subunit
MIRYIDQFAPNLTEAEKIIRVGEGLTVEFKSTLRWNVKENRKDPQMEHAVLKTVAAFLNSDGGILLIGVEEQR